jgi:uncharacterized protein (UPF0332 family)
MRLEELQTFMGNSEELDKRIKDYTNKRKIKNIWADPAEISGHIGKAEHNLRFVQDNLKIGYLDWCITGCYYAVYHAALALIISKGYSSKSHDATLCLLIKEFFNTGISKADILLVNKLFLDYQDLSFYVDSKKRREEATYSSKYLFDQRNVEDLKFKAIQLVGKMKRIIEFVTLM